MSLRVNMVSTGNASCHVPALVNVLTDAIHDGASLGFLLPFTNSTALGYWNSVLEELELNQRQLWIAMVDDELIGTVQLNPNPKENGWSRAEVQKLIVHTKWRNQGVASNLMATLENHARQMGRKLVYLDTQVGSAAEWFYLQQGYKKAGEIPDYASSPNGELHGTAIYYKQLMS